MGKRSRSNRQKLSFAQANAICRKLVPIGDEIFHYMEELAEAGFVAWAPYHKFVESFAHSQDELDIHRRCLIEEAKTRMGQPWPIRIDNLEHLYFSPFLQELRGERDRANGIPADQLSNHYSSGEAAWRREFDPCERRRVRAAIDDNEGYNVRWNQILEEQRRCLKKEAIQHSTGLVNRYAFDKRGRCEFFVAAMERDATSLGFRFDEEKSYFDFPVFSMSIIGDWDICWALEEPKRYYGLSTEGRFIPYLEIRSRGLVGSVEKAQAGEFLFIRYQHIVPGFGNAYWIFHSLAELEAMIRAHLFFYKLMAPIIESAIRIPEISSSSGQFRGHDT